MRGIGAITLAGLAACAPAGAEVSRDGFAPRYGGIETRLLADDLVNVRVSVAGAAGPEAAAGYARCAAAQYTLIRGYAFLRHVRTTTGGDRDGQTADAIYTISPALPAGSQTIDAEVTVADCARSGIPTV